MFFEYVRVIGLMLRRDLLSIKESFRDNLINVFLWLIVTVAIKVYVLPYFGVSNTYGEFILVAAIASAANLDIMHRMMTLAHDITSDRQEINYDLLLPLPSKLVFVQRALFLSISGFMISIIVLPIGKILFWNHVNLSSMSVFKFLLALVLVNILYGYFAIFLASITHSIQKVGNTWMRIIFPLWFLGCFEFSWLAMRDMAPNAAYVDLLNPYTYTTEGLRSAVLDSSQYIPYWISIGMMVFFSIFIGWVAVNKLKKRLDTI